MFWKQSEAFKGSFRTGTSKIADVLVQTLTILDILIVIVHYCFSARCPLIWKLPLKPFVSITLPVSVYFKTINTRSFTEKCGLGCAPTIFVQFFYFLLHSSIPVLGFTYRKHWNSYRRLDYVTCTIIRDASFPSKVGIPSFC